jgi:hypothetical protein
MKKRRIPERIKIKPGKDKDQPEVAAVKPGDQTILTDISSPSTDKKIPEPMEIHHTRHHDRGKERKAYFFDFLMLFLAITAGFFVENQREHYLEHQREKQYAQSLYDDLKVDTAIIQRVMEYKKWNGEKMDSLLTILASPDIHRQNELIYYFERLLTVNDLFTAQDVTYQQLQSSGNFRYISNKELYKEISDYYNLYHRYQTMIEDNIDNVASLSEMESSLFHAGDLTSLFNRDSKGITTVFNRPGRKFHPVKKDDYFLNYFYIKAANRRDIQSSSVIWLMWLHSKAAKILAELEKEYNLF